MKPTTFLFALATAIGSVTAVGGAPAAADDTFKPYVDRNGVCDPGEFCYSYNSNFQGSISDFQGDLANYGSTQPHCYEFRGPGNGKGQCIKNNAAAAWNRTGSWIVVYYNSGHRGVWQGIAPGANVNLNSQLKNNNASHESVCDCGEAR